MTNCILSCLTDFNITFEDVVKTVELILLFAGCVIAGMGLSTWRQQVIEQPKIELAREIVESFYNVKDLIKRARCPLITFSPDDVRKFYEKTDLTEYQCGLAYRLMVLDKSSTEIPSFQRLRNKAKVIYSSEIENCFFEVNKIINQFQHACEVMIKETSKDTTSYGKELIETFSSRIYDSGDGDITNLTLTNVIKEVEYNLKPIYETKAIKWKKLNQKPKEQENDK